MTLPTILFAVRGGPFRFTRADSFTTSAWAGGFLDEKTPTIGFRALIGSRQSRAPAGVM
jgi:hypothetical protein